MPLILPNDIANEQLADGDLLQQNFATLEDWGNQEAITRDGSTAMTNALLLPGPPTNPNEAATKGYVDTRVSWIGQITAVPGTAHTLTNGASAITASIPDVAAGNYMVHYACLIGGDEEMIYSARLFINTTFVFQTMHRGRTSSLLLFSNIQVTSPSTINVDIANGAAPVVNTYADSTNHRLILVRGQ